MFMKPDTQKFSTNLSCRKGHLAADRAERIGVFSLLPGVFLSLRPQSFLIDGKVRGHQQKYQNWKEKTPFVSMSGCPIAALQSHFQENYKHSVKQRSVYFRWKVGGRTC